MGALALVVGGVVLLLAIDAWRLAAAHNARVDEQERAETSVSDLAELLRLLEKEKRAPTSL